MSLTRLQTASLMLSASTLVSLALDEGYKSVAYIPVAGDVPTLGFGATEGVKPGDSTSVERALVRLLADAGKFEQAVKRCAPVPMYSYEFSAFVRLTYNIGETAFCKSTLAKKLNALDYPGACQEILRWDKFNGKSLPGLTKRRKAENAECTGEKS